MKWNEYKLNVIWRLLSRNLLVKHTQWKFKKKVLKKLNENICRHKDWVKEKDGRF